VTSNDPVGEELRAMLAFYQGPTIPLTTRRRPRTRQRRALLVALAAVLICVSVASAREFDLLAGQPATDQVKAQIASAGAGAPAALDPKIEAGKSVIMITLPVKQGTASLVVAPAADASYCMGVTFSWLANSASLGCDGPSDATQPIASGITIPGVMGQSPVYVYGRVRDASAARVRITLADGSAFEITLTHGFFLANLDPDSRPTSIESLDSNNAVLSREPVGDSLPPAP
jgi:hypothetical protein